MSLNMIFLFVKIITDWFYDQMINLIFGSLILKQNNPAVRKGPVYL